VLFHLLTGRPPFQSNDVPELVHRHLARAPPAIVSYTPRSLAKTQPMLAVALGAIDRLVRKLLAKQVEERYQSVRGVQHDLDALIATIETATHPQNATTAGESASSSIVTATRALAAFEIGSLDFSSTFRTSQRLCQCSYISRT